MNARKSTPRGQMTRGGASGPAVMLMPPEIRSIFMPNPPLQNIPKAKCRRKQKWSGVSGYLVGFEKGLPPPRKLQPTPKTLREQRKRLQLEEYQKKLEPEIQKYRKEQRECGGEYGGMNCYNTLFIGRLAYEVTERKLLREMEAFGPIKDIKIIYDNDGKSKSRGYAFVEYEHEEDMKRAYRAADGMRIEGREIVVDVERGHTVPTWLPRRLGGGLGGTRLGGTELNVTRPGRYDPTRPDAPTVMMPIDGTSMGRGGGMMHHGYGDDFINLKQNLGPPPMRGGPGMQLGPPPGYGMGRSGGFPPMPYGGGPPQPWDHGHRSDSRDFRKRQRSRSPDSRYGPGRRR